VNRRELVVQPVTALFFFRPVTFNAVLGKNRPHVARKIHRVRRWQSHSRKSGDAENYQKKPLHNCFLTRDVREMIQRISIIPGTIILR